MLQQNPHMLDNRVEKNSNFHYVKFICLKIQIHRKCLSGVKFNLPYSIIELQLTPKTRKNITGIAHAFFITYMFELDSYIPQRQSLNPMR